jgi:hypothetical protein
MGSSAKRRITEWSPSLAGRSEVATRDEDVISKGARFTALTEARTANWCEWQFAI